LPVSSSIVATKAQTLLMAVVWLPGLATGDGSSALYGEFASMGELLRHFSNGNPGEAIPR